jgi:hypothetical protein
MSEITLIAASQRELFPIRHYIVRFHEPTPGDSILVTTHARFPEFLEDPRTPTIPGIPP